MQPITLGCGALLRETTDKEAELMKVKNYIYLTVENGSGFAQDADTPGWWMSNVRFILHRESLPGLQKAIGELIAEDIARKDAE